MLREVKARTARSARALKERQPREHEHAKKALFLKSGSCSDLVNEISRDLHALKKPDAVRFTKRNPGIHPFEDPSSLEFFSTKNDTSLICFSSHSKKKPHALTFMRCFDGKALDMLECTLLADTARTAAQFAAAKGRSVRTGLKPMLSFSGVLFDDASGEEGVRFRLAKSIFTDFFRGGEAQQVDVEGLQELISFAASEEDIGTGETLQTVHMRVWRLVTHRSGQRLPRVELEEIGPRLDLRLRRYKEADPAVMKQALKQARGSEPKSRKNIDMDALGDKTGRIHLGKQDLSQLQTRKMKGLKRQRDDDDDGGVPVDEAMNVVGEDEPFSGEDGGEDSAFESGNDELDLVDVDDSEGAEDDADVEMATPSDGENGPNVTTPKRRKMT